MEFSELEGKILTKIENQYDEVIIFTTDSGEKYRLLHHRSCCESVAVEDITGDLEDLLGTPILVAEEISHEGTEEESCTWTYYKLATVKGYVTIRWFGSSNGYYSESVDFEKIT